MNSRDEFLECRRISSLFGRSCTASLAKCSVSIFESLANTFSSLAVRFHRGWLQSRPNLPVLTSKMKVCFVHFHILVWKFHTESTQAPPGSKNPNTVSVFARACSSKYDSSSTGLSSKSPMCLDIYIYIYKPHMHAHSENTAVYNKSQKTVDCAPVFDCCSTLSIPEFDEQSGPKSTDNAKEGHLERANKLDSYSNCNHDNY